ncbi:MAG: NAD(P)/FAD-dependent oxidoreductase [Chitinophagaceae bacterium]
MEKQTVIIIGGGAAGLMAARELAGHYNILILEARPQLGGRIRSHQPAGFSRIIEAGAEFIHGDLPLTYRLLKQAGMSSIPVTGSMYRKEGGAWKEQTEMVEGWDELLRKMKREKTDMPMYAFLQKHFGDAQHDELRRHAIAFAEGFDVADIRKVSMHSLYEEWSKDVQDENARLENGYGMLIRFLQEELESKGCRIHTNCTVKQVDWESNDVTVYANGEKYRAEKAIITVPVSVLRKAGASASINFTPALDPYIAAAGEIGVGAVIKVVLQFRQPFWKEDAGFVFSNEIIPTWWTQLPDSSPVLTGWAGGSRAAQICDESDAEILEKALLSLAAIFDKTVDELKANLQESAVFNWQEEPEALGAYTYAMPGTPAARKLLNTPVADTLYFAGEGLYEGPSPGTVEAALMSGKEVAKKVLKS